MTDEPQAARDWLFSYLATAAIWGTSFLFIKVAVQELHPLYMTLGRAFTGAVALLLILAAVRRRLPRDPATWGHLMVAAALGVVVPFTLFGYAEQHIPSLVASIWNATTPLLALPFAAIVFRIEAVQPRRLLGLLIGFVGALVVLEVWQVAADAQLSGQLMSFAGAVCFGFAIPYQRRFLAGRPESPTALVAGQMVAATVQLLLIAPLLAGSPPDPTELSYVVVASMAILGPLGTGVAFVLNFRVIRMAGATTAVSVTYLIPVISTILGVTVLGEYLKWNQPVGAAIVLLGVYIAQSRSGNTRVESTVPAA